MTTEDMPLKSIIRYFDDRPKLRRLKMAGADLVLKRRPTRDGSFAIIVTDNRAFGSDTMFGRITDAGEWKPSIMRGASDAGDRLATIAVDVQTAMIEEGKATGQCCYCGLALSDPESVERGYGPICAKKYGLPHSNRHGF